MLVVGLGNPGTKYEETPHNLGFEVVDELARRWHISNFKKKFSSELADYDLGDTKVWLLKPQTYMNHSGQAVQAASQFFKVPLTSILVVSDDLDLPPGVLRVRTSGGAGGHNGLKSVIESLGTQEFPRVRIGVGRGTGADPADYLLSNVSARRLFKGAVEEAANAVECILKEGMQKAMNTFNQKKDNSEP